MSSHLHPSPQPGNLAFPCWGPLWITLCQCPPKGNDEKPTRFLYLGLFIGSDLLLIGACRQFNIWTKQNSGSVLPYNWQLVNLRISWTDADELRNSPAETWHVWEEETVVEGTRVGDSDLDEDTSDFWELDGINRRRNLVTADLDFLGSGKTLMITLKS